MKPFLRSFALLCLPSLAVLLAGLFPLLRTGQADPRGWALPALILIPAAAVLTARRGRGAAWWMSIGALGTVLCCLWRASSLAPLLAPTMSLAAVGLLATLAGLSLARCLSHDRPGALRYGFSAGLAILAVTAAWMAKPPVIRPATGDRPALAVISGLPLFWQHGVSGPAARADAPIITVLRQRFRVRPLDTPLSLDPLRSKRLLLAQPRPMSGAELVALDTWVRGGGEAVILADPHLRWPVDLPLGDRRRPPSTTLLNGLLGHWGVVMIADGSGGDPRHFLDDGRMVTINSPGRFSAARPGCRIFGQGLLARCRVGHGGVVIVADADLIDDRLWLADPATPLDTGEWTADTPEFLAVALGVALPTPGRWVRSGPTLVEGVRLGILVGIFWAGVGAVMIFGSARARFAGSGSRPNLIPTRKRG